MNTVGPYVPKLSLTSATTPFETAFTGVPTLAAIPTPFQRIVVLFGLTWRPNR